MLALASALPCVLGAPEDRALALGLPFVVLGLGVLVDRLRDAPAGRVDIAAAALLACPGVTIPTWLVLRAEDALQYTRPENQVFEVLNQTAKAGPAATLLVGAALALGVLRGSKATTAVVGLLSAAVWLGASFGASVVVRASFATGAPNWALHLINLTGTPYLGALFGGAIAAIVAHRLRPEVAWAHIGLSAFMCAWLTNPLGTLVEHLSPPAHDVLVPVLPPGPRVVAEVLAPSSADLEGEIARHLRARGFDPGRGWMVKRYRYSRWHLGLRGTLLLALPGTTGRATLDRATDTARDFGANRFVLAGISHNVPAGIADNLFGHPTTELLLDRPPDSTIWGRVRAAGLVDWDATVARPEDRLPYCGLVADPDVSLQDLAWVVRQISRPGASQRCNGVAWAPTSCQPEQPRDADCPAPLHQWQGL